MRGTCLRASYRRAVTRWRGSARSYSEGSDARRWDGGLRFARARMQCFRSTQRTRQEAKPPSHARMVLRRFRKEVILASFAAEAQAPMVMTDKTELATTV